MTTCKYDYLAQECFGKPYCQLELDDQIFIKDQYLERNE